MSYWTHVPATALHPYVRWAMGYRVPASPTGVHRGLPSRDLTLVLELVAPLRVTSPAGTVASHAVLGGLHVGPALIDASLPQEGVQYAVTPLGAAAVLGLPAGELSGRTVALADVLGTEADALVERVAATSDWAERFRLVDAALLRRLARARTPAVPPQVAEAWRLLHASAGRVQVASVAASVGWSRRHLGEQFRHATGLTPKQAARIARFDAARDHLLLPDRRPLAELALACGYADQPHLAREFRAMAGCSIGTWLREELPFVQDAAMAAAADSPA